MQEKGKFTYRSGTSFPRGMPIDGWVTEEEREKIYTRWKADWPKPLMVQGGVTIITCELIKKVPQANLNRTFGKILGEKLTQVATRQAVL